MREQEAILNSYLWKLQQPLIDSHSCIRLHHYGPKIVLICKSILSHALLKSFRVFLLNSEVKPRIFTVTSKTVPELSHLTMNYFL